MIDFTSRQLRAFLLVAQHRSFTRAAGALFITPSGLSILIRELENQLGVRLFDRTTRHVALTALGAELVTAAQYNLRDLDSALSRISQTKGCEGPSLSVGAPPLLAAGGLAQAIKAFRTRRPELRFQVFDGDSATTMRKVESGELDMGVGFFFRHMPGIRRSPLFRFSLMVIRPSTLGSSRPTVNWSALRGERFVTLQPSIPLQQFIDKHLASAGVACQSSLVLNYLHTQIAMVEAGVGIAVVPSFALPECRNRGLTVIHLTNPVVRLDCYQIRKGGRRLPPAAEEFTTSLQNYIVSWARESGIR
jgi:DNA-binding transcriptional LysR family regulator